MCSTAPRSSAMTASGRISTPAICASVKRGHSGFVLRVIRNLCRGGGGDVRARVVGLVPFDGPADRLVEIPSRQPAEAELRFVDRETQEGCLVSAVIVGRLR